MTSNISIKITGATARVISAIALNSLGAKGRATKGRGTSFKGALVYVLHDKDAQTSERVGFVEMHNLATDDPHRAWREMKALCDAADELKKRSGVKATGRKLTKPVYAFTLNWHEADNPDAAHMRETAADALRALGMENRQAVIVAARSASGSLAAVGTASVVRRD